MACRGVAQGGIRALPLELMMVWQPLRVQKLHDVPLIPVGEMYAELVDWCRKHMLRDDCPLASAGDMDILVCVKDGPSILRIIREKHAAWKNSSSEASA